MATTLLLNAQSKVVNLPKQGRAARKQGRDARKQGRDPPESKVVPPESKVVTPRKQGRDPSKARSWGLRPCFGGVHDLALEVFTTLLSGWPASLINLALDIVSGRRSKTKSNPYPIQTIASILGSSASILLRSASILEDSASTLGSQCQHAGKQCQHSFWGIH